MKDFEAIFNDSYDRVLTIQKNGQSFFDHFYDLFIKKSPSIEKKFAHTDMQRQKDMLKTSFYHMLNFFVQKNATEYLERIAILHRYKIKVTHFEYGLWIQSLVEAVHDYDPKFCNDVEIAWRVVMAPGMEFMKYYSSDLDFSESMS